jgi:predicted phage-related endonuclease
VIEWHKFETEAQWLELRNRFRDVTASVAPALYGLGYMTRLKLHLQMSGVDFSAPDRNDAVLRRGRWMEPAVALAVSERHPEWKIEPAKVYLRDPELRLGATPDFFIHNDPRGLGVLECKTVAPSKWESQWDRGRTPPLEHILQNTVQMMLSGAKFGYIAALLVDAYRMDLALCEVPGHPGAEDRIRDDVRKAWADVAAGREPQPDYARDAEAIRVLTRTATTDKAFDATGHNELPVILAQRAALMARIKQDRTRCDEIENEVKHLLGDAVTVNGLPDWRISFKPTDFKGYTVKARTSRVLRITDKRPAEERPDGGEEEAA